MESDMVEQLVPILKVVSAEAAIEWYARLGFSKDFERRYSEDFPAYVGLTKGPIGLHLSEHPGDATPDTLMYLWVDDVDAVAKEFDVDVVEAEAVRELSLTDPDGNRVRIGARR